MPEHARWIRRLARALPGDAYERVFEPSYEDLRAAGHGRGRFILAACLLVVESYRVSVLSAIRSHRPYRQREPEPQGAGIMDTLVQDTRYAARMLMKNPGFTAVAVLALALGIGANASIFSLIYGLFMRPLPYAQADRLVRLWGQSTDGRLANLGASVPKFEHIRAHQQSSIGVAADSGRAMALTGLGDEPQRLLAGTVTSNYFDVLGVPAFMGRTFRPEEEERAQVAVVTRAFWTSRLNADPAVLGRAITLGGVPYTIVGVVDVMPPSDVGPSEVFLPMPYALSGLTPENRQRGVSYMRITGRLKPGVTIAQARAEAALLGESYQRENREKADSSWREVAIPIREDITGNVRPAIMTLLGAVALVLMIACSNVANLLTARFAGRRREIALRGALGAARGRIIRLFLVESVMLSIAGAVAGLAVATLGLQALPAIGAVNLPLDTAVTVTAPVLWATIVVALATGLLMGAYPAIQAARPGSSDALKDGGRGSTGGRNQHRVRATLVACQVALSLILLVGAALLMTSFMHLRDQEPGFDHSRVLTANISLALARYPTATDQSGLHNRLLDRLRAMPGVRRAALGNGVPLTGNDSNAPFARGDGNVPPLNERPLGLTRSVTPDYFSTLSIPLIEGRDFTDRDTADAPPVIILSQNTAKTLFPDVNPIGRTIFTGSIGGGIRCEIVGVVGDVRSLSLAQANDLEFYRPMPQRVSTFAQIVINADGDPLQLVNQLRAAVRAIDPELPVNQPTTLSEVADASLGQRMLIMTLLGVFAGLAIVLATVGIFSVVSYLVGQRTNEIGIRLALGAPRSDVLRLMTWEGVRPVFSGLIVGVLGVFALGRLIASQLYGVSVSDPATLLAATVGLGTIALVACIVPARRATQLDPMVALRTE